MNMTNEEIIREYQEAKQPRAQIRILADENECKPKDIANILIDAGLSVPKIYSGPHKPAKPERESFELETTTEPDVVARTDMLTVADLIEIMKTLPQNVPILGDGFRLTVLKTLDMGTGKIAETIFMEYPR